jgi:protein O-mannosyl-transferase
MGVSHASSSSLSDRRTLVCCLGLIVIVLVSYRPVLHNGFLNYDDDIYITFNPHIKAGLTWPTVKWAFTTYDGSNWHPLAWLSHALDYDLFGLNPAGTHGENVLLHAVNAILLFLLLRNVTGCPWRGMMVAGLFALHPINVESVAWAAERKNILSMFFFLLALHAYIWYTREPRVGRYASVVCLYALALLAKPQVITFPFLLWLLDYWPLHRFDRLGNSSSRMRERRSHESRSGRLILEKVPLLALSAASAISTLQAQRAGSAVRDLSAYTLPLRLETAVISYVRYLGKALWPSKLVAVYPHPTQLYVVWQVVAAVFLLLLITAWVFRARETRYLVVGWLWFLGSLVPMIGVVQAGDQAMADRFAYISFVGLFLMIVWLVSDWAKASGIPAKWLALPAFSCLLILGALTYRQVGYWHDAEWFWVRTLALTKDNFIAHEGLADVLRNQGRIEEAVAQARAALAIHPGDASPNLLLGDYEHGRGNLAAAIERYQTAAISTSNTAVRARAYAVLGMTYRQIGQRVEAKQCLEMSLQLAPHQPIVMLVLGLIAHTEGDLPTAIQQYSRAVELQPTDVGFLLLANALQQEGNADEANAMRDRAAHLSSNLPEAQKQMESLLRDK